MDQKIGLYPAFSELSISTFVRLPRGVIKENTLKKNQNERERERERERDVISSQLKSF